MSNGTPTDASLESTEREELEALRRLRNNFRSVEKHVMGWIVFFVVLSGLILVVKPFSRTEQSAFGPVEAVLLLLCALTLLVLLGAQAVMTVIDHEEKPRSKVVYVTILMLVVLFAAIYMGVTIYALRQS